MTKAITLEMLEKLGACENQVALFKSLFGESVIPTPELAQEHGPKFNIDWLADKILNDLARAEYKRATNMAWAEYMRINDAADTAACVADTAAHEAADAASDRDEAVYAAAEADTFLAFIAEEAVQILIDLKSPGTAWLDLAPIEPIAA